MTFDLKAKLLKLGLSQAEFSRLMGLTPRGVNNWAKSKTRIPQYVISYLEMYERHKNFIEAIENMKNIFVLVMPAMLLKN